MFLLERHFYFACCISLACVCFIAASVEFTARQNEYFVSDSTRVSARSGLECSTVCGQNNSCQAVNYNQQTSECDVLTLQPTDAEVESRQNWTLYTRKINTTAEYEEGWVSFNSSLYLYVDDLYKTWDDADAYCKTMNAELVDIHSAEEHSFLGSIMKYGWIGLKRNTSGTGYFWSSGKPLTYSFPDWDINQHICVYCEYSYAHNNVFWSNLECSFELMFTCEKPIA